MEAHAADHAYETVLVEPAHRVLVSLITQPHVNHVLCRLLQVKLLVVEEPVFVLQFYNLTRRVSQWLDQQLATIDSDLALTFFGQEVEPQGYMVDLVKQDARDATEPDHFYYSFIALGPDQIRHV